jgi:RNA polymerase sigma-70 factor (ECF subfamily)
MAPILNQEAGLSDYTYKGQSLSSLTDDQIVQLIRDGHLNAGHLDAGHLDAFAELYHRYSADIYSYIWRLVSSQNAAEDLLQEIFVAIWQAVDTFEGKSSVKTWLFRIAHYKTMSWMRSKYRDMEVDEGEVEETGGDPMPDVQIALNWRAEMVQEALGQLSSNHRAVVELFYFHGLSYGEISQVVRCPVGTIKSRMSHALQNLNGILTNYGLEP